MSGDKLSPKSSPKDAALIALRRAEQEAEPVVVAALIAVAIRHITMLEELQRPRRTKKAKGPVTS